MQAKSLINFLVSDEKKVSYTAACKDLGVPVSEICRRALDNAILLSDKLKTHKTSVPSKEATPHDSP